MTRSKLREQVFLLVFRAEFHDEEEMKNQLSMLNEGFLDQDETLVELAEEDRVYIQDKAEAILSKLEELDAAINEASHGWKTTRMNKVDLSILRLALYEIKYEEDTPDKVSVNEAVEIAKRYGTTESKSFVNGVLGKFVGKDEQ